MIHVHRGPGGSPAPPGKVGWRREHRPGVPGGLQAPALGTLPGSSFPNHIHRPWAMPPRSASNCTAPAEGKLSPHGQRRFK